jgi:predicted DNA-binding transcriptional regulator AlpA
MSAVMARPKAVDTVPPAPPVAAHSSGDMVGWFDIREMARRLRVSPLTVRRMVRRGDLYEPAHFGNGLTRWSEEGYRRWYAARAGLDLDR